jgi:hypothetical protein
MAVTIELPAEVQHRLENEAVRRGITLDQLIAELAAALPADDPLESFIGSGSSGRGDLSVRHREIRAEQTASMTASDF